jgi:AAA family ATPase
VHQLAATTHGFVGADLAALVNEAALSALRRHIQQQQQQQLETQQISVQQGQQQQAKTPAIATEQGQKQQQQQQGLQLCVTWDDIAAARLLVKPSALREVAVEVPQVRFKAKSKDLKQRCQRCLGGCCH